MSALACSAGGLKLQVQVPRGLITLIRVPERKHTNLYSKWRFRCPRSAPSSVADQQPSSKAMVASLAMPISGCGATCAPVCTPQCRLAPVRALVVTQSVQRAHLCVPEAINRRGVRGPCARTRSARLACGAATMENEFAVMDDEAEDFYQLLGVVGHLFACSVHRDVSNVVGALCFCWLQSVRASLQTSYNRSGCTH